MERRLIVTEQVILPILQEPLRPVALPTERPAADRPVRRLTLNLSKEAHRQLEELSRKTGSSMADRVRQGLSLLRAAMPPEEKRDARQRIKEIVLPKGVR